MRSKEFILDPFVSYRRNIHFSGVGFSVRVELRIPERSFPRWSWHQREWRKVGVYLARRRYAGEFQIQISWINGEKLLIYKKEKKKILLCLVILCLGKRAHCSRKHFTLFKRLYNFFCFDSLHTFRNFQTTNSSLSHDNHYLALSSQVKYHLLFFEIYWQYLELSRISRIYRLDCLCRTAEFYLFIYLFLCFYFPSLSGCLPYCNTNANKRVGSKLHRKEEAYR